MKFFKFLSFVFLLSFTLPAQDIPTPTVAGYITALSSNTNFDVDNQHVVVTPQTELDVYLTDTAYASAMEVNPTRFIAILAVGDDVQVFGEKKRHTDTIIASKIVMEPTYEHVTGFAVIQQVISTSPHVFLMADGYFIAITPKTEVNSTPPLTSPATPAANMWVAYTGRWNRAGLVVAERITYSQFDLSPRLKKGLLKSTALLLAPNYGDKAGDGKKDGKIVAPYIPKQSNQGAIPADAALQQRVQRIGERLIPACQKNLAKGDPQKIDFRFYAFADEYYYKAVGSPDGLVVIPTQIIGSLQNDDQVAAVLADGVAQAVEWKVPMFVPPSSAGTMIVMGEMPFVGPIASLALLSGGIYQARHGAYPGSYDPWQNKRVGLSLLQEAGYDVRQAPVAWQLLGSKAASRRLKKDFAAQSQYVSNLLGLEYGPTTQAALHPPTPAGK